MEKKDEITDLEKLSDVLQKYMIMTDVMRKYVPEDDMVSMMVEIAEELKKDV